MFSPALLSQSIILQKIRVRAAVACGLLLAVLLSGCSQPQDNVRGVAPVGQSVLAVRQAIQAPPSKQVTLRGEMVEKCPIAGCWFKLHDKSGTVRVDTNSGGFTVMDVALHTQMTVQGHVAPGATPQINASGIRF